jgi:hypothetical protein
MASETAIVHGVRRPVDRHRSEDKARLGAAKATINYPPIENGTP